MAADRSVAVPERVRRDAARVMAASRYIAINRHAIAGYAAQLVAESPLVTTLDRENHFVDDNNPTATAAYILALDSINFGSGVFAAAEQAGVILEYAPVAQRLKLCFEDGKLHDPQDWLELTPADCHSIFAIPVGCHALLDKLMAGFQAHLHMTAHAIQKDFGGVADMLRDYQGRGADLLEVFASWPHFHDVTAYNGQEIAIFKRAQIMLADMELALAKPGVPYFGGLETLTCFADNMVPHVLRTDGILAYDAALASLVDDPNATIEKGSAMESELRCSAIHVVELMRESLAGTYTSVNLDHMLWHRGYLPGFSTYRPHRSLTTWY